jgi:hypothetical protein
MTPEPMDADVASLVALLMPVAPVVLVCPHRRCFCRRLTLVLMRGLLAGSPAPMTQTSDILPPPSPAFLLHHR